MLGDAEVLQVGTHGEQKPVFLSAVQLMQSPQNAVSSLVWFDSEDKVFSLFVHSLYFSSKRTLKLWGGRVENWEARLTGDLPVIGLNESTGEIVKSGSEGLENISCDKGEIDGDSGVLAQTVQSLMSLRITLYHDSVRVGLDEKFVEFMELTEVMVGPLDL